MLNVIRRATLLTDGGKMSVSALPPEIVYYQKFNFSESDSEKNTNRVSKMPLNLKDAAAEAEAEVLKKVLEEVKYNRTQAAKQLGIDRKTLFNKMKQYDL